MLENMCFDVLLVLFRNAVTFNVWCVAVSGLFEHAELFLNVNYELCLKQIWHFENLIVYMWFSTAILEDHTIDTLKFQMLKTHKLTVSEVQQFKL